MNKNLVRFVIPLAIVSLFLELGSCKSTDQSGGDLEAIALSVDSSEAPVCRGKPTSEFKRFYEDLWADANENSTDKSEGAIIAHPGYKPYLENILATVPTGMLNWYFRLGGKIRPITNASIACAPVEEGQQSPYAVLLPFEDHKGQIAGCIRVANSGTPRNDGMVELSMPETLVNVDVTSPETVYQTLSNSIQGIALLAAYFTTELQLANEGATNGGTVAEGLVFGNPELVEQKRKIAFYIADDLANAVKNKVIGAVPEALVKQAFNPEIFNANLTADQRWAYFSKADDNTPGYIQFSNTMFAQVLTADMCNDKTRAMLQKDNPVFIKTGKQVRNETKPAYDNAVAVSLEVQSDGNSTGTESIALTSGGTDAAKIKKSKNAPTPPEDGSLSLRDGILFPRLRRVVGYPFAVSRYLIHNSRVVNWFRVHRPLTRTAVFVSRAGGFVIRGTGRILHGAGRLVGRAVTFPFRLLHAIFH